METIKIKVYNLEELSQDAQKNAYNKWLNDVGFEYPWEQENKDSLDWFASIFPVKIKDWSIDLGHGQISWDFTQDQDVEELTGIRLMKFLYNNYWQNITKGKLINLGTYKKHKFSKIFIETYGSCPFTGYYMDDVLLTPIYDFLKKPHDNLNFEMLLNECLESWVDAFAYDLDYMQSFEYFKEEADANNFKFTENGEIYNL